MRCRWTGSTGAGYEAYDRAHEGWAPPAEVAVALSADPAFRGDAARLNPEQLVVLAASSCQLLSFLAVVARARVEVLRYEDEGEGIMAEDDAPTPTDLDRVAPDHPGGAGTDEERVRHLVKVAHRECYIANSLRTEVRVEPTVVVGPSRRSPRTRRCSRSSCWRRSPGSAGRAARVTGRPGRSGR